MNPLIFDGTGELEVARRLGLSRPAVWRWQLRYAEEGVEALLPDKTRRPGKAPVPLTTVAKAVAMTCAEPPGDVTHWTGRAMAKATGLSLKTIQRKAHKLAPIRCGRSRSPTIPNSPRRSRISSACT